MVVVTNFHKGLDLGSLGDFLLSHGSCHFSGIVVNTSHRGMAVRAVQGAIVNVLNDDGFVSRVASSQDQHHFPGFHELFHFCREQRQGVTQRFVERKAPEPTSTCEPRLWACDFRPLSANETMQPAARRFRSRDATRREAARGLESE